MNNAELLDRLAKITPREGFEIWVGSLGYDTRPHVSGNPLPVAHKVGFAEAYRAGYEVPAGDMLAAIRAVSVGFAITVPDFHGSHCVGEWIFARTNHGWTESYR